MNKELRIGFDIGGTGIFGGLFCGKELIACRQIPTPKENLVSILTAEVSTLQEMAKVGQIGGIGIGFPGIVDRKTGEILSSANLPFGGLSLGEELSKAVGVKVKIDNDGNAAALGEYTFGAATGYDKALILMIGTGFGGALVEDGKVLDSELGHCTFIYNGEPCGCGRKGCAEAYVSATALLNQCKAKGISVEDGKQFFQYIQQGNPECLWVLDQYMDYLAQVIISLSSIYLPQIVVVSGGITGSGELFFPPLEKAIQKAVQNYCYKDRIPPVIPSSLGEKIGVYGAVSVVDLE